MPELPEVEVVRLSLEKRITGLSITGVTINKSYPIKYNTEPAFTERVKGKTIENVARRGKFLLLHLVDPAQAPENLIVHLGMTGAFLYSEGDFEAFPPTISNHIFVIFTLSNGAFLIYSDYRRFGSLRVVTDYELLHATGQGYTHLKTLQQMGTEPFLPNSSSLFLERVRSPKHHYKPIKDILLDQTVAAGIGNIYANEACFPVGVNPYTSVGDLEDAELLAIYQHAESLMALSITLGGSSIRDYVDGDGKAGTFQDHLKVYNQSVCSVCGTPIEFTQLNSRATYHCPVCQPE